MKGDPCVEFLRTQRDWLLKEAPPRIGQKAFIGKEPTLAGEYYYFLNPRASATNEVKAHLQSLKRRIEDAKKVFSN